jgi:inner membrane protein
MDNVTHAALGIAAGIAVRRSGASLPAAALAGLLAAEGPDLDVFIRSAGDPLVSFRWHRHFTHSFAFSPVWALLAAWISAWFFRRRPDARWRDLLLPGFAGALTHLLCDACTSYGTMLLWPFDHGRYAWDCLPIVDLFATLPLLVLAIMAWKKAAPRLAVYGLAWFTRLRPARLLAARPGGGRPAPVVRLQEAPRRAERVAVKPTAFNLVVWRCVWLESGRWHTAAVRVMPFARPQVIVGESRAALTPASPGLPRPARRTACSSPTSPASRKAGTAIPSTAPRCSWATSGSACCRRARARCGRYASSPPSRPPSSWTDPCAPATGAASAR